MNNDLYTNNWDDLTKIRVEMPNCVELQDRVRSVFTQPTTKENAYANLVCHSFERVINYLLKESNLIWNVSISCT